MKTAGPHTPFIGQTQTGGCDALQPAQALDFAPPACERTGVVDGMSAASRSEALQVLCRSYAGCGSRLRVA